VKRYLDPADRVRIDVIADPQFPLEIELDPYVPVADLFAGPPDAFLGVPAVGHPIAEVSAALEKAGYPRQDSSATDLAFLRMPMTEIGRPPTASLHVKGGVVVDVACFVEIDKPEHRDALVALVTKKLGAPVKTADGVTQWAVGDEVATLADGDPGVVQIEIGKQGEVWGAK